MAKIDIKHAFRLCPVRPEDYQLLGMRWLGEYYFDTRLPFGGRSSPYIFNGFADALAWILIFVVGIPFVLHYLDDFLIVAGPQSPECCSRYVNLTKDTFASLGVPIAKDKLEGPSTCLTYLGIEIDTDTMIIRLPPSKLEEIQGLLHEWVDEHRCAKAILLSLIGKLSFAAKVVKPGRLFLRRLIDLSKTTQELKSLITINSDARKDIRWWDCFLLSWNGVSIIQSSPVLTDDLTLFTDTSGSLGFGALYKTHWFPCRWPANMEKFNIAYKELFAVVVALQVWGSEFVDKQIVVLTDNQSICDAWRSRSARDPELMRLFRFMFFNAASLNFNVMLQHIPGHYNHFADLLSRLQVSKFKLVAPRMDAAPTPIPPVVWTIWLPWPKTYSTKPYHRVRLTNTLLLTKTTSTFATKFPTLNAPITEWHTYVILHLFIKVTVAAKTIKSYLCGNRYYIIRAGFNFDISNMHNLYYLIRGIKRSQGNSSHSTKMWPNQTETPHDNVCMASTFYSHIINDKTMIWSACTLAFFGLLHVLEYTTSHIHQYNRDLQYHHRYKLWQPMVDIWRSTLNHPKLIPLDMVARLRLAPPTTLCAQLIAMPEFSPLQKTSTFHPHLYSMKMVPS